MADKDGPRDWDKELAEIDKLMAGAPAPTGKAKGGGSGDRGIEKAAPRGLVDPPVVRSPAVGRKASVFTWLRLGLGITLGVAMTQWPYTNGCGLMLFAYLGGVAAVIVAALWSLVSSWRTRSGFAHFLSVALLFWGSALAAREVLPRIGYAKDAAAWTCAVPAIPNVAPVQPSAVPPSADSAKASLDSARTPAPNP